MKKILVALSSLVALALFATPAQAAEEKNPNKLMTQLTGKLGEFKNFGANYDKNPNFQKAMKYICQKGSAFSGVFGVCRSGEGIVCGAKKEAFVACSIVCSALAKNYEGFDNSKCVSKHASKWGFTTPQDAVAFAKTEIANKAGTLGPVKALCPMLKKIGTHLPPELHELATACP
jgi:hypothetical protein